MVIRGVTALAGILQLFRILVVATRNGTALRAMVATSLKSTLVSLIPRDHEGVVLCSFFYLDPILHILHLNQLMP